MSYVFASCKVPSVYFWKFLSEERKTLTQILHERCGIVGLSKRAAIAASANTSPSISARGGDRSLLTGNLTDNTGRLGIRTAPISDRTVGFLASVSRCFPDCSSSNSVIAGLRPDYVPSGRIQRLTVPHSISFRMDAYGRDIRRIIHTDGCLIKHLLFELRSRLWAAFCIAAPSQ
jgi:hypothetical protein